MEPVQNGAPASAVLTQNTETPIAEQREVVPEQPFTQSTLKEGQPESSPKNDGPSWFCVPFYAIFTFFRSLVYFIGWKFGCVAKIGEREKQQEEGTSQGAVDLRKRDTLQTHAERKPQLPIPPPKKQAPVPPLKPADLGQNVGNVLTKSE